MTSNLDPTSILKVAPGFRLQWEEAQACYVILYPEGMVKLSASAGEIMKHCDGKRSIEEITAQLNAAYPQADLAADVSKFLEVAYGNGWLRSATTQ